MSTLYLALKTEYFEAIRNGSKLEEYRAWNDYWTKRLVGREYSEIVLTKGYPRADDMTRRIIKPWRGFRVTTIIHPLFGNTPTTVYAIDVSG